MANKTDTLSEGGEPEEQQTPVSIDQAQEGNDSGVEEAEPSHASEPNNSDNEVTRVGVSTSNEIGRDPPHSTDNENEPGVPSSTEANVQPSFQGPAQGSTTHSQENFDHVQENMPVVGGDTQNPTPGSDSNRSRDSAESSEGPDSSSTENGSAAQDNEQNQPFAVRISPLRIRIGGVTGLFPSSATPSNATPSSTPPSTTPPSSTPPPTTPPSSTPPPSTPPSSTPPPSTPPSNTPPSNTPPPSTPPSPLPPLPSPPPTPPSLPPMPPLPPPPPLPPSFQTGPSQTNTPWTIAPPPSEPVITEHGITEGPTATTPFATPTTSAVTANLPAATLPQEPPSGTGPRNDLGTPRSPDVISPVLRSWINAGINVQRAMRSLHSANAPGVVRAQDSTLTHLMISEMMAEARSQENNAQLEGQALVPPLIGEETPESSGNEYNRNLADQQNNTENNRSHTQSNLDDDLSAQALNTGGTEHITHERPPELLRTPRFSHTHRYSHTTGPLTPLPRARTPETPLRNVTPPPTPQQQTPRILQRPQPPSTPRLLRLLPPASMSHFIYPSEEEDAVRQNVYGHAESSMQTPQQNIRPMGFPPMGFPNFDSDGPRRPPRVPRAPGTPVNIRISRGIASRLPIPRTPSSSLPPYANAHRIMTPPVTAENIQRRINAQSISPTGVHDYQVQQQRENQRIVREGAVQTLRTVEGHEESAQAGAAEESNETDMAEERPVSEEEERRQLWGIPTPSCQPPKDPRREDDDPTGGAGGGQITGKFMLRMGRTSLKRSQATDTQQRKRQSRGRGRAQNSETEKVTEKSEDPKPNGPSQKHEKILTFSECAPTDISRKHNTPSKMALVSHAASLRKICEEPTARHDRSMENTATHPTPEANFSNVNPENGGSDKALVGGPQDDFVHRQEHDQEKRNTLEGHAAGAVSKDRGGDNSERLANSPRSNPVDLPTPDGNRGVQVHSGASVRSHPPSSTKSNAKQVSERETMRKTSSQRGGRDSPEIEAWLEEPWIPEQKGYSSENIIRAKEVRIYKTIPKPARSRSSDVPTPQRGEPSAAERQEKLRLHLARLGRDMHHSDGKPASG